MVVPVLKMSLLSLVLLLSLHVSAGMACFGPKLFIGLVPGLEGEMRYHLVSIYLHEKTGIDSTPVELKDNQTALDAIALQEIDLGFAVDTPTDRIAVLQLDDGLKLYSGERPLNNLQFSTVGRVFKKLQKRIDQTNLNAVRQRIRAGSLPATAIRDFMMEHGWI